MMKTLYAVLIGTVLSGSLHTIAQNSKTNFWSPINEQEIRISGKRQIVPQKYTTWNLNTASFKGLLFSAPSERQVNIGQSPCIVYLPMPDGSVQAFRVVQSPIMDENLAASFPDIKTFSVKGIDDPYANGKLDWNEFGFHGMILTISGDYFIDPYCPGNTTNYISYFTKDFVKDKADMLPEEGITEKKKDSNQQEKAGARPSSSTPVCIGTQLRSYRLAIACTGEYAKAATGSGTATPTMSSILSKVVTSINRVDGVYEKEVAVRLILVSTTTLVLFGDPNTDPFTGSANNNSGQLINLSQSVITATVGSANFDIGHTFSTGAGGLANLGVVCVNSDKAMGVTGSANPVGDPYDIDYVAHEMGHQFNGNHTFNAITDNCNGNRYGPTSVEPGSGVTIMAYAGICGTNNLASNSIPYFHAISYDEINFYLITTGSSCPVTLTTGNQPPVVTGSADYIIPVSTPFVLTGSATDPDNDVLTYSWEETDPGSSAGNWNSGSAPYFRSYNPVSTPARFFPSATVVSTGNYTGTKGEYLPGTPQVLEFRLTVRDNKMGGGGVCSAVNHITFDAAGPFNLTYPSAAGIIWGQSSPQTITWDVNGTDQAPVSCDTVKISISYNNGNSYSVLANSVPNTGFYSITAPTVVTTVNACRIKIECKNNIFYDVSNNSFVISTDPFAGISSVSFNNPVGLIAWPNPFSNTISFASRGLNSTQTTFVNVTDISGKLVLNQTYEGKNELKETINMSELDKGVYFITVSNDGRSSVHKIIKE